MLVGWAFSFMIEGLSGFGTPAALAAPILVGLGFPPLSVAAMCLIMNSVPVSFGAVGTVLALQSACGAMGNMVCIHNIVAVSAVLGLSEKRDAERGRSGEGGSVASILRLTIGPHVVYALIAAAMAWVFAAL